MKKKHDTNLNKSVQDLEFDMIVDDLLLYENLTRKKIT
jgi:hypothetical protein